MAGAGSHIELVARSSGQQVFERQNVGFGQVLHVDVIADAGSIGRSVVFAKNRNWLAGEHGAQDERDEMRFRLVLFA